MGYSTSSSRVRRATSASSRFTVRFIVEYIVARTKAVGAAVAELFREAPGTAQAATPGGVQVQTERSAATVGLAKVPSSVGAERHAAAYATGASKTQTRVVAELHRPSSPVGRTSTPGGAVGVRQCQAINSNSDRILNSDGSIAINHTFV